MRSMVVADMPFMSLTNHPKEGIPQWERLMKEAGASAVKLEGGHRVLEIVASYQRSGYSRDGAQEGLPQSIHQFGSYRTRGTEKKADQILRDAKDLERAGCCYCSGKIPSNSRQITEALTIPTIGIGAGVHCDGQILVYTDMLGITNDFQPRFVRRYDVMREQMLEAVGQYINDVRTSTFPSEEEVIETMTTIHEHRISTLRSEFERRKIKRSSSRTFRTWRI